MPVFLIIYALTFLLGVYPVLDSIGFAGSSLYQIKGHDFGMYALAQITFCALIWYASRSDLTFKANSQQIKWNVLFIVLLGILLRVSLWWAPSFTTDTHRYLSDGLNTLSGNNPYQAPTIGEQVSYPGYRTIYPALSQALFALGAAVSQKREVYKFIFGLGEIALLWWVYRCFLSKYVNLKSILHTTTQNRTPERSKRDDLSFLPRSKWLLFVFFMLNPLVIFECHAEGHLEVVSIFLFLYAAFLIHLRRNSSSERAALFSLLSFMGKFYGALLYPLIFLSRVRLRSKLKWASKNRLLIGALGAAAVSAMTLLPFLFTDLTEGQSGVRQYFKSWHFSHGGLLLMKNIFNDTQMIIKVQQRLIFLWGTYNLILWFTARINTHQFILRCITGFLILFPVQHPWYFLIGLYGVLFSHKYRLFWMTLLSCIGLNYLNYAQPSAKWSLEIISLAPWLISSSCLFRKDLLK